jgi:hypothetical protein
LSTCRKIGAELPGFYWVILSTCVMRGLSAPHFVAAIGADDWPDSQMAPTAELFTGRIFPEELPNHDGL